MDEKQNDADETREKVDIDRWSDLIKPESRFT